MRAFLAVRYCRILLRLTLDDVICKHVTITPRCQEVLLDKMVLGDNIAKNAALRENVFIMTICVELRIPLFLVGKPGSSKSLAKSIISDSMKGRNSANNVLKCFREVSSILWHGTSFTPYTFHEAIPLPLHV